MNLNINIKKLFLLLFPLAFVTICFIQELMSIYKIKKKLNNISIKINNFELQKFVYHQKLNEIKNYTDLLNLRKEEEALKIKELIKMNSFYGQEIEEGKSDYYIIERKNDIMEGLMKFYEKNNISSINIINNLQNYFFNNTLKDYFNNISNILIISSIIKNESDINFIYNKVIKSFYNNSKNNKNKYILGSPCFKAILDSNDPLEFHKKCDNVGDTIMLIKTNKTRFGGITDLSWGNKNLKENEYNKTKTKLFNLDNQNIFMFDKNQKISRHIPPIRGDNYYFAIFGYNDIYLGYLPWESSSSFPQLFLKNNETNKRFNDLLNQYISPFLDDINFEYQDVEVYPILSIKLF